MNVETQYPDSVDKLCELVAKAKSLVPASSRTSTVLDFATLKDATMLDLTKMPSSMEMVGGDKVCVRGPVSWSELRAFLRSEGRDIKAGPTEESASVLAGVATSATGEKSFGFGPFRDHIVSLKYVDALGETRELGGDSLEGHFSPEEKTLLKTYQRDYETYREFKNAPFPKLEREVDLMIGTEGQLGIVIEAVIETAPFVETTVFSLPLPRWENDIEQHVRVFELAQAFRERLFACELIDARGLTYLREKGRTQHEGDIVLIEAPESSLDDLMDNFFSELDFLDLERVIQLSEGEEREIRMSVPRWVQELNAQKGVTKKGTDAQFAKNQFREAFSCYRELAKGLNCPYTLFGHFGDNHLHFNFLPRSVEELEDCQLRLEIFYRKVLELKGSPFAEHGIGLIKQPFVLPFWGETQKRVFQLLKENWDPKNKFFPQGFMTFAQKELASE